MEDLELYNLLIKEKKEICISLLIELCQKNKKNRETIILLLIKK
jgi:hypothetical protein